MPNNFITNSGVENLKKSFILAALFVRQFALNDKAGLAVDFFSVRRSV